MAHIPILGRAGVHDLTKRNEAFGGKLVWKMYSKPHSTWCNIMQQKYLNNNDSTRIISILDTPKGSVIWDFMIASRDIVVTYVTWEVNNNSRVSFLRDSWNGQPPLSNSLISQTTIKVL